MIVGTDLRRSLSLRAPTFILVTGMTLAASNVSFPAPAHAQTPPATTQALEPVTAKVVAAANAFLATLDEKQRAAVLYRFDDEQQRARWSNFPTMVVQRGGLRLKDLTDAQRAAAMQVVAAALSPQGFEKVQQIMQGDEVLKSQPDNGPRRGPPNGGPGGGPPNGGPGGRDQGGQRAGGRGPGGPGPGGKGPGGQGPGGRGPGGDAGPIFGKDLYYISLLGTPSDKDPWMLQFGGHHLALNITIVGEQGVLTPTLTAAQPGSYTIDGKTIRPLGRENDEGFALLAALDEKQRKEAVLNYSVTDLVLGPGHDGETIQPEGLKASAMNDQQQAMLLGLIAEWSGIVNDSYAAPRMAEIKQGLNETYFAWSGPTTVDPGQNGTSYYRIQGPKLVIEYAPQRSADHIHTMYRDPTNDYGRPAAMRPASTDGEAKGTK